MNREELLVHPMAYMQPARVLDGLSAEDAARRIPGLPHSVVEIAAHMVFWQAWFLDRCAGHGTAVPAHAAEGWPAVTAADWPQVRQQFLSDLQRALEFDKEGHLDPPIEFPPMNTYSIADAMTHMALHNAHHLGQIVTLRQALGAWPPPAGSYTW